MGRFNELRAEKFEFVLKAALVDSLACAEFLKCIAFFQK